MVVADYLERFLPGRPNDPLDRKLNPSTLKMAAKQIKGGHNFCFRVEESEMFREKFICILRVLDNF
jgi:hypothetical protein